MGSEQQQIKNPMHSFLCMGRNIFRGTTQISLFSIYYLRKTGLSDALNVRSPTGATDPLPSAGLHSGSSGGKFVLSSERKEACSR